MAMPAASESAIVLCGGRSTRMGRDKASLPFGPETLAERVARIVGGVVPEVVLVGRAGQSLPAGAGVAFDHEDGLGPLSGIAAGLHAAHGEYVFAAACDLPLLSAALVRRLLDLARGFDACVPVVDGYEVATCAVFHRRMTAVADELLRGRRLRASGLFNRGHVRRVPGEDLREVDSALESFLDCDTPERYHSALVRAGYDLP